MRESLSTDAEDVVMVIIMKNKGSKLEDATSAVVVPAANVELTVSVEIVASALIRKRIT